MGAARDAALALVALVAFAVAVAAAGARFSLVGTALGAAGTVAFELLASRRAPAVRRVWNRPAVQLAALAAAFAVAAAGATVAPSLVLWAGIGALVCYLAVLSLVSLSRFAHRGRS